MNNNVCVQNKILNKIYNNSQFGKLYICITLSYNNCTTNKIIGSNCNKLQ